ncbi:MAG: AraC family transcriptional regulator [Deltaproteobacteria bacterium]|nr:AraC family transcriptional regulator [Deltaproteobacteria bacterium]MBW2662192.1 AraC family transcriptional regulator [Deltaproteobacteria bacterium]
MNYFDRSIEKCNGFETNLVRMIYYDIPDYFKDDYRSYEYHRICSIIEGEKHVKVNNQEGFTYDKNQFLLLPPESKVEMEIKIPTRAIVLELSDYLIDNVREKISMEIEVSEETINDKLLHRDNSELIDRELDKINSASLSNIKGKKFLIDLYAQEITYKLLNNIGTKEILTKHLKNPIVEAIEIMRFAFDREISLSEIAQTVNMSPQLFSIKFKRITGCSPNKYFTAIKINAAKKMLINKSVTDVSFDLGYDNISHFIHLFKDEFGLTPKQYQLKNYPDSIF